jgi:hypothetical protein
MASSDWWTGVATLVIAATSGCSSSTGVEGLQSGPDGGGDANASPGPGDSSGPPPPAPTVAMSPSPQGPCKAGAYAGTFGGSYASPLASAPLVVTGTVSLSLVSAGTSEQTCMFEGEVERCSDFLMIQDGGITGVANASLGTDDAQVGGYPYSCTTSGTLWCSEQKLVGGWVRCTVCPGPASDGGSVCSVFAGPLVATYDYGTLSFTGTWNAANALAGGDGGPTAPDGQPISDYLSLDGGYGDADYGGSGTWTAHP